MTGLEKQMAEALTECKRLADACPELNLSNYDPDDVDELNAWAIEVAQAIDALHDAQAAEQAAGGASFTTTGDTNGRHDGLRRALHGGLALGGYTPSALADVLFASDDVMSSNAKLGLTMDQLVPLAQAVLGATHPALAAPSDPQPRGAEPQVWLYDFMDGATTVRNWSTTNKAEAFAPGNFNQRGYVPAEN